MSFEADVNGHKLVLDAEPSHGGEDKGPRPKALLLAGLAGCTGMDVVSILLKMKVDVKKYKMTVKGMTGEEHPKVFDNIHLTFEFWGFELPLDKIEKAIGLSREKYCAVSVMLGKTAHITYDVIRHEG
jgi:putative redox protein